MGKSFEASNTRGDLLRQKNGSYKIREELAISLGLDPAVEYRSKGLALAQTSLGSKTNSSGESASHKVKSRTPLKESRIVGVFVASAVSAYVTWLYFWDLRRLPLGLIDDHEFLSFLGDDGKIEWSEIPDLLAGTEVGAWGEGNRFRPGYYLLRILQAKFFSVQNGAWHEARLFVYFLTLAIIGYAFWLVVSGLLKATTASLKSRLVITGMASVFSVLAASSFRSWGEVIPRLGPAEILVGLGASLVALAVVNLFSSGDQLRYWFLGFLGITIAVTSKENSVVLLLPLVALFAIKADLSKAIVAKLLLALSSFAIAGWVVLGVVLGIANSGADVYGNVRSAQDFWTAAVKNPYLGLGIFVGLITLVFEFWSRPKIADAKDMVSLVKGAVKNYIATIVAVLMIIILIAENFIYQQDIYPGYFEPARYGLVSEMGLLVSLLGLGTVSIRALFSAKQLERPFLSPVASTALVAILTYSVLQFGTALDTYPKQSLEAQNKSGYVHGVLRSTAAELAKSSPGQLVMLPGAPLDFELIASLPIFLELYTTSEAKFFVSPAYGPEATKDPFWISVMDQIDRISEDGSQDRLWRVSPLRELDRNSPIVCFWFVEEVTAEECSATFGLE